MASVDWDGIMVTAAAEMKGKTNEQILRAIVRESDMERDDVKRKIMKQPKHVRRGTLIVMLAQVRYYDSLD